jgi:hypothetical protein
MFHGRTREAWILCKCEQALFTLHEKQCTESGNIMFTKGRIWQILPYSSGNVLDKGSSGKLEIPCPRSKRTKATSTHKAAQRALIVIELHAVVVDLW